MVEWVGERGGEGGVRVYEASEVKKGGREISGVFYFAGKRILYLYIFMKSLHGKSSKNAPLFTTHSYRTI
jgi:hypothetical protein